MLRHASLTLAVVALACGPLSACTGPVSVEHEDHEFEDGEDVDLGTAPWRSRRRMDVDQLDTSMRQVTGGIGWDRYGGNPRVLQERYFVRYADTLGVPDYVNSSSEDLSASLLFVKFLDDAARSVCRRTVDRETADGGEAQDGEGIGLFAPVDVEDPEPSAADVNATLTQLLVRFHGRQLALDDPQLAPWRTLYAESASAVAASEDLGPERAWEAVCVALMTHPDFYTY